MDLQNYKRDMTFEMKLELFETQRSTIMRKSMGILLISSIAFIIVFTVSLYIGDVTLENLSNIPAAWNYIKETIPELRLPSLGYDIGRWYARGGVWLNLMVDTILIAFISTMLGVFGAFVMSFPASRNLMKNNIIYFTTRRILDIARSVPSMVYALLFVFSFGLGPLPGVLAIAIHSVGSLGKLFSEVNENISMEEVEGIRSTGGNWTQSIWFAVVPQVLPNFISYSLLRLEWNIRAATVIGLVGAGGIGMELMTAIRQFQFTQISALTLMIIALVMVLDAICEKLRHFVIGKEKLL
jgi:phosphonate transport system permease protein